MNRPGQWLQPRHATRDVFEKDYPTIETQGLVVSCPGCKENISLCRRSSTSKLGGWCKKCNRGVGT